MSDHFQGQIEIFGFTFPPKYWAQCAGQILPIQQNQALFALLGTTYGGNGVTTFALPDMRGRVALSAGKDFSGAPWIQGQTGGQETVALTGDQIPAHTHSLQVAGGTDTSSNTAQPGPTVGLGQSTGSTESGGALDVKLYVVDDKPAAVLHDSALSPGGSGAPHENRMPLLALNFCIALSGVFPSRN